MLYEILNARTRSERLAALTELMKTDPPDPTTETAGEEVNNHVHTIYSFSPYSPTMVAYLARRSGLRVVGSIDHDSVGAAREMIEAAKLAGIGSTVGCEIRAGFTDTPFESRRLNSPDSLGIAYVVLHGIPVDSLETVDEFLRPIRESRNVRNRLMVDRLNTICLEWDIEPIDFERDVWPVSQADDGGTITERHLLYVLAGKLIQVHGTGNRLIAFLEGEAACRPSPATRNFLADTDNPHYRYDLLGLLKTELLQRIYVEPGRSECPPVTQVVRMAQTTGAILAYPYLGDVTASPTGDKRPDSFEDSYLDELIEKLAPMGFNAVTYMPPRNTMEQLRRVQTLCREHGLMEISGVDINSSRQSFRCEEIHEPGFHHLVDTTWALVAHEKLASADPDLALFARGNPFAGDPLPKRLARYSEIGRRIDSRRPEDAIDLLDRNECKG
jgi:hypothetical protein